MLFDLESNLRVGAGKMVAAACTQMLVQPRALFAAIGVPIGIEGHIQRYMRTKKGKSQFRSQADIEINNLEADFFFWAQSFPPCRSPWCAPSSWSIWRH